MIKKCVICNQDYFVAERKGAHKRSKYCSAKCKNLGWKSIEEQHRYFSERARKERRDYPERSKARLKKYRDTHKSELSLRAKIYITTPSGIYTSLKSRRGGENHLTIDKDEFIEWYSKEPKVCFYCGIMERELSINSLFYNKTHKRLTIDRLDNNKPYETGNLVLACQRCNGTKSDFFTVEEMREIASKYIRPKWEAICL